MVARLLSEQVGISCSSMVTGGFRKLDGLAIVGPSADQTAVWVLETDGFPAIQSQVVGTFDHLEAEINVIVIAFGINRHRHTQMDREYEKTK